MSDKRIKTLIADTFLEVADALKQDSTAKAGDRLCLRRQ